jgi:uncharacterized protein with HEPN domain
MKKPIDLDRLKHIIDAIEKIDRYLKGLDLDKFVVDDIKIDAVVRNLEIIGEAAVSLTRDLKARYPDVEWRYATAARNRLIHGYFDVDPEIVWDTAQNNLPKLKADIRRIIEELK